MSGEPCCGEKNVLFTKSMKKSVSLGKIAILYFEVRKTRLPPQTDVAYPSVPQRLPASYRVPKRRTCHAKRARRAS